MLFPLAAATRLTPRPPAQSQVGVRADRHVLILVVVSRRPLTLAFKSSRFYPPVGRSLFHGRALADVGTALPEERRSHILPPYHAL
jgi:hypothetical protein